MRPGGASRSEGRPWAILFTVVLVLLPAEVVAQAAGASGLRVLDGRAFSGTFGPRGADVSGEDTFIFEDGLFTSTGCIEYGFEPRPYWVRESHGALYFLAEMISEEHGTIVYTGRIDGDTMDATYVWTRDRWYWSIEREFWFKGKRTSD